MAVERLEDYRSEAPAPAAGGGGGTSDERLRALEIQLARVDERLRHLEGELKRHFATKAWILTGVLGGMGIAAGVAVAIVKLLSP